MKTIKPVSLTLAVLASAVCLGVSPGPAQELEATAETNAAVKTNFDQPALPVIEAGNAPSASASRIRRQLVMTIGRNVEVRTNEYSEAVVVIGGSAKISGHADDCVVIGGDLEIDGEVRGSAVAVLGSVKLGPNARVNQDVVAVGGKVERSEGATIHGQVQEIDFEAFGLPHLTWLKQWFTECVLKLRPLSPRVGWVWVIAGGFFLFYFLVAVAFPRPVQVCVGELAARPATTFVVGLITKLLVPIIVLVLALTGIGLLVVPLLLAVVFFGAVVGKVALIEYLGGAMGRAFGLDATPNRLLAFFAGTILIVLLYLVPVLGFVTFTVLGIWGLGIATTALFAGSGRERKRIPTNPPGPAGGGSAVAVENIVPAMTDPAPGATTAAPPSAAAVAVEAPAAPPPASLANPLAGFWERMGAAFLDVALLCIPISLVGPFILVIALAYFAGMWAWKGTTIGGIVLKLKVVRYDGQPVSFLVALVRGLAAAFSAVVLFLGFFWIGWDPEKQGWHDKIAGTVVVRLPRSTPLVCV